MRDFLQIARLALPSDQPIQDYKDECFNTGKIMVLFNNGSVQRDVQTTEYVLQNMVFPDPGKNQILGSALLLLNAPRTGMSIAIDILPLENERITLLPGQKVFGFPLAYMMAEENGEITISSFSGERGNVNIRATNENKDAAVNIESNNINGIAESLVHLSSFGDSVMDVFNASSDKSVASVSLSTSGMARLDADKEIQIGSESLEPAIKGNKLYEYLKDFTDEVIKVLTTVPIQTTITGGTTSTPPVPITGTGLMQPLGADSSGIFQNIQQKLEKIRSGLVKLE